MFTRQPVDNQVVPVMTTINKLYKKDLNVLFLFKPGYSTIIDYISIVHLQVNYTFGDPSMTYIKVNFHHQEFLFIKYESSENRLQREIREQDFIGLWNAKPNLQAINEQLDRQFTFADQLTHPNIARVLAFVRPESVHAPMTSFVGILMELPIATVHHYLMNRTIGSEQILLWAYQLTRALQYLHSIGNCSHGDVRPVNILVKNNGQHVQLTNMQYISPINNEFSVSRVPFDVMKITDILKLKSIIEKGIRPKLAVDIDGTLKKVIEVCWRTEKRNNEGLILPLEPKRPQPTEILKFLDYN